jgi:magnesium-protoporphyrin O-methyltransferase
MKDCCQAIDQAFSEDYVQRELRSFLKRGPARTTAMLIEALRQWDLNGLTLLDIGGGLGAIPYELLPAGVRHAIEVEASSAYYAAALVEARRRGLDERIEHLHADFIDIEKAVPAADIVTLDRVICCYEDAVRLVSLSCAHSRSYLGLVYPRNTWWIALALGIQNFIGRLTGNRYRAYMHPKELVERLVNEAGFVLGFQRQTLFWRVVVFTR